MKTIYTVSQDNGKTYDMVGMNNKSLWSDLKTIDGAHRRARRLANGKPYRLEFITDSRPYDEPFRTDYSASANSGIRFYRKAE